METLNITLVDDIGCELLKPLASSGAAGVYLASARGEEGESGNTRHYFIFKLYRPPSRETWAAEENELRVLGRLFKQFVPGIPKPFRRLKYQVPTSGGPEEIAGGGLFRLPGGKDWDSLGGGWRAGRDFRVVFGWMHGLCDLLQGIHEAGVVHGGVNPGNVLWEEAEGRFCLIDFTAAVFLREDAEKRAVPQGPYTSPERLAGGEPRLTDDVYALGVTMFEWLAGRGKFPVDLNWSRESNEGLATQLVEGLRQLDVAGELRSCDFFHGERAVLLPPLAALVQKCLHADPSGRYQKMGQVLADLRELERMLPEWARRPGAVKRAATGEPEADDVPTLAEDFAEPTVVLALPVLPPAAKPADPNATAPQPSRKSGVPLGLVAGVVIVLLAGIGAVLKWTPKEIPPVTSAKPLPADGQGDAGHVVKAPAPLPVSIPAPAPDTNAAAARQAVEQAAMAQARLDQFRAAAKAAQTARDAGDLAGASNSALKALEFQPGDAAMLEIKDWAAVVGRQVELYRDAMAAAKGALTAGDFERAARLAGAARVDFPTDEAARTLQAEAQNRLDDYHAALNSVSQALRQGNYATALALAGHALVIKPNDPQLRQWETEARQGVARREAFQDATNHLQLALGRLDYTNALGWAAQALTGFPGDAAVAKIRDDIQLVLDFGEPPRRARGNWPMAGCAASPMPRHGANSTVWK